MAQTDFLQPSRTILAALDQGLHNQSLVLVFGRRAQARASGSISPEMPTVAVIPRDDLYRKGSTIEEIRGAGRALP
jgi:hypothetical protein